MADVYFEWQYMPSILQHAHHVFRLRVGLTEAFSEGTHLAPILHLRFEECSPLHRNLQAMKYSLHLRPQLQADLSGGMPSHNTMNDGQPERTAEACIFEKILAGNDTARAVAESLPIALLQCFVHSRNGLMHE